MNQLYIYFQIHFHNGKKQGLVVQGLNFNHLKMRSH